MFHIYLVLLEFKNLEIKDVIINKHGIDILPTNIKMSRIETELGGFPGKESYLKDLLKEVKGYDYCLIDCPPSLSMVTHNALTASDEIYVPVKADYYSIEGIADLLDEIDLIKRKLNENLKVGGVFMTMVNTRTSLFQGTKEMLNKYFKSIVFESYIRVNEDINKSVGDGKTVIDYKPSSNGAKDYLSLVDEIVLREEK